MIPKEFKFLIINLSQGKKWVEARTEGEFHHIYEHPGKRCVCTNRPIYNVCVLKNKFNGRLFEVGVGCAKEGFGLVQGENLFAAAKRIRIDVSKSLGKDALDFCKSRGIINDYEYSFYENTGLMRNLSGKQDQLRKKINRKFLDFVSGQKSLVLKMEEILNLGESGKDVEAKDFIKSIRSQFLKNGRLTDNQSEALNKVYYKLFNE